ncbi:hypothetical protein VHA01S_085_00160 [Vibrio halioticoli NBRC 102217]|uniref:Uncharacterized protein n=1 Tax=Vibrio halioticoli NBRC 102217 TaxID=1219072 RepID=V5F6H8_9VIBR|nr:hypothetical protein [Vibrio halioticoli]GAD91339.1 hypothetical protein VHA01S_085_00160 [Vibrio halioticoli NBRC 102217]
MRYLMIILLALIGISAATLPVAQLQQTEWPSLFENSQLFKNMIGEYLSLQISGLLIALMCLHLVRASLLDS